MNESRRKLVAKDRQLNCAFFRSEVLEVGSDCGNFCLRDECTRHIKSVFGGCVDCSLANSEIDVNVLVFEATALNGDRYSTGELAKRRVDLSDRVAGTNNLIHSQSVQVVEPTVVPATKDKHARVCVVIRHGGVFARGWRFGAFRFDLAPDHSANIEVARAVDVLTESSSLTLVKVGAFTAKNEVLPSWDGLNHDGGMIPAGNVVVDVWIAPFVGIQVEHDDVVVLSL